MNEVAIYFILISIYLASVIVEILLKKRFNFLELKIDYILQNTDYPYGTDIPLKIKELVCAGERARAILELQKKYRCSKEAAERCVNKIYEDFNC